MGILTAVLAATLAQAAPDAGELDVSTLPFSPDSVKMVIESAQPRIQECYEALLATANKPVNGTLFTTFVIKANGTVAKAKVVRKKSSIRNAELNHCVVAVLSTLSFPKAKADHPIEFPFNLRAEK